MRIYHKVYKAVYGYNEYLADNIIKLPWPNLATQPSAFVNRLHYTFSDNIYISKKKKFSR